MSVCADQHLEKGKQSHWERVEVTHYRPFVEVVVRLLVVEELHAQDGPLVEYYYQNRNHLEDRRKRRYCFEKYIVNVCKSRLQSLHDL